MNKLSE